MSDGAEDGEKVEGEHRTLINLLAAIAVLVIAIAAFWLISFLDEKRKIENCVEAGRRDCLQRFDPAAAPGK